MQMSGGVLLDPTRYWYCPECGLRFVTKLLQPHSPLHQCPEMANGAWVPYIEKGIQARLRINRREDYQGSDILTLDGNGVPVMSVTTLRDEGEDCHAFAPCITTSVFGLNNN